MGTRNSNHRDHEQEIALRNNGCSLEVVDLTIEDLLDKVQKVIREEYLNSQLETYMSS